MVTVTSTAGQTAVILQISGVSSSTIGIYSIVTVIYVPAGTDGMAMSVIWTTARVTGISSIIQGMEHWKGLVGIVEITECRRFGM